MAGIDWDQIEVMQEEAQVDLAEVAKDLRDNTGESLEEGQARFLQLKANVALSILSISPPSAGFGAFPFGDPREPEEEEAQT